MTYHLVVTTPFAAHQKGDLISDQAKVAAIAVSHPFFVTRIQAPEVKVVPVVAPIKEPDRIMTPPSEI